MSQTVDISPDTSDFQNDMESLADGSEILSSYKGSYSREEIYADHN